MQTHPVSDHIVSQEGAKLSAEVLLAIITFSTFVINPKVNLKQDDLLVKFIEHFTFSPKASIKILCIRALFTLCLN